MPDSPTPTDIRQASDDLELRCPTVTIETAADLTAARACRVIDGDLKFGDLELDAIADDDLPNLEVVTGSVISAGGKQLERLSLPNLREVGGDSDMSILEIALDAHNLRRVLLPRLHTVHGGVGIFGLYALQELDLRSLREVDGSFVVATLPRLMSMRLNPNIDITDSAEFQLLCALPYDSVTLPEGSTAFGVGCCTESSQACETTQCDCAAEASARE